ncbi:MAG: VWA domain-containing protein [Spirochaetaceae bacterium]|nr:VWA domain-containing protein [Spirochaetaceae bacterium]
MKNKLTEIVFILDRSGSMSGLESDTIGGYNSLLEKQKLTPGKVFISTILFNNFSEVIHDRLDLQKVSLMSEREYCAQGCTALLDAIGGAIKHMGNIHKYAREEDRPENTLFIITTDGMENSSRNYNYEQIKKLIQIEKEKYGWEFIFLGANIDAIEVASRFGISEERAANYNSDSEGTKLNFKIMDEEIQNLRMSRSISPDWKKRIDKDYNKRNKKC